MVNRLKSTSNKDICPALRKQMSEGSRLGFRLTMIRVDGEFGVEADEENMSELARAGVTLDTVKATEVYNRRADIMREAKHEFEIACKCTRMILITVLMEDPGTPSH
jgi:hypothetical protein